MPRLVRISSVVLAGAFAAAAPAAAQPLGTFSWQMTPHCNVVTVAVVQNGSTYTLDGHDTQCNTPQRAPVSGVATPNPDGTITLGFTIVAPGGESTDVAAVINLATLSGPWTDSGGHTGNFLFNGPGGGVPRPTGELRLSRYGNTQAAVLARRSRGSVVTQTALQNADQLFAIEARGHDGAGFGADADAAIRVMATQNWTPTAHGNRILFSTTANGSTGLFARMAVDHDGDVGIGTLTPAARLHVNGGNIRVAGCVEDGNGSPLVGVCASDARFKKEIRGLEPVLDRLSALTPSRYFWRADEFPDRAFGAQETMGLVAQDVEAVLPELVSTTPDGFKAVDYSRLPLLAVQAIKELKAENDRLRREIDGRFAAIEARLPAPRLPGSR